jgi:hypothetical protein
MMIDLTNFKILKYVYPYSSGELGEQIWDKMNEADRRWAVRLTLESVSDTGDLEDGSYDTFFTDDKLKVKIDEMLEKYLIPYVIVDQTELLVTEPTALSEGFMVKLEKYLSENITVDDVLDRISEVGLSNITVFEKYYIDKHKDDEQD